MSSYLIWKGILILALNQPSVFKDTGGVLWISNKESVKTQSQVGQVTLLPIKKNLFYLSGFQTGIGDPTPTLVTTPANLLALQNCSANPDISVRQESLTFTGNTLEKVPLNCGFDDLSFDFSRPETARVSEIKSAFLRNENKLQKSGIKLGRAEWKNGKRQLNIHSSVEKNILLEKIPESLRPFYELNFRTAAKPGKNLIFQLTLFEFSRQQARKLGLKWPDSISLLSLDNLGRKSTNLLDTSGEVAKEISLEADFGESQGVGKVLAQPTLRTQPGIESRFLSGGEFPVKNSNAFHSQTAWKSYGLKISLTPTSETQIGDSEVAVDFKLEFSEPNMEHAVEGIPSLVQRQLESRFDIRTNELTILTSMLTLREGQGRAGAAFLNQLPLLGYLFSENSRMKNDSELWFALRPTWEEIPLRSTRRPLTLENTL